MADQVKYIIATWGGAVLLAGGCSLQADGLPGGGTSGNGGSTTTTTTSASSMTTGGTGGAGAGATVGGGGVGNVGAGGSGGIPLPTSCATLPDGSSSGLHTVDPNGATPEDALELYCDVDTMGGGWALLFNSIGQLNGSTPAFWNIPYDNRFDVLGSPALNQNYYAGVLYLDGDEYFDEVVDTLGAKGVLAHASTTGLNPTTMHFLNPLRISGDASVYAAHFGAGWSSPDRDEDTLSSGNCAANFFNITQHYGECFVYSLGARGQPPIDDSNWGPHVASSVMGTLSLNQDPTPDTRVTRISRWVRW